MAKAAGPVSPGQAPGDDRAAIEARIEGTRAQMDRTVSALEARLSPAHIKEQVADVTEQVKEQVADLKEEVVAQFRDAKEHIKDDLQRDYVVAKRKVQDEFNEARYAVREATVGRVEHMMDDAKNTVRDAGGSIVDTIRENPIPAAMIALGIGWLVTSSRRSSRRGPRVMNRNGYTRIGVGSGRGYDRWEDEERFSRGYGYGGVASFGDEAYGQGVDFGRGTETGFRERASNLAGRAGDAAHDVRDRAEHLVHDARNRVENVAHEAKDRAEHFAHDARDRAQHFAHDVGDRASHFADEARHRADALAFEARRRALVTERTFERFYRENPLAVGAAALAVGCAIGLAIPHTEREDEWLGDARDRFVDRAESMVRERIGQAHEAIDKVAETGMHKLEAATSHGGEQGGEQTSQQQSTGSSEAKNGLANGRAQHRSV